jgi:tRNA(His) 5'-end guanylyltransferase
MDIINKIDKTDKDQFGTRMKAYEQASEIYLDKSQYTIVRIDGHGFSKWTKGFQKPFDDLLVNIMSETSKALMDEFHAVVSYSQSDEITLIFLPDNNLIYSGRVQKLASLTAGFATMVFNKLLNDETSKWCDFAPTDALKSDSVKVDNRCKFLQSKVGKAFFDARVFQVPTDAEAFNQLLWRTKDCERNSKNVFAQSILSHKECQNLTSNQLVELCNTTGHFWNNLPTNYRFGIIWKKGIKEVDADDYHTKEPIKVKRSYFMQLSQQLHFSSENVTFLLSKHIV